MGKYKSRAARASECASDLRSIAEELRDLDIDSLSKEDAIKQANDLIGNADFSEIDSLAEEMGSWRDNMSGTNLENSEKYSRVEEAADALDNIEKQVDEVEDVEDIEDVAEQLDEIADELEQVEFVGMYG